MFFPQDEVYVLPTFDRSSSDQDHSYGISSPVLIYLDSGQHAELNVSFSGSGILGSESGRGVPNAHLTGYLVDLTQ